MEKNEKKKEKEKEKEREIDYCEMTQNIRYPLLIHSPYIINHEGKVTRYSVHRSTSNTRNLR